MGTDMSSVDAAFGFQPHKVVLRARLYAVNTAPTINIPVNSLVCHGGAVVSTPYGYMMDLKDDAVIDGAAGILGSVIGCYDENMKHISYIAAGRVGNGTIAGYVMVADHPDQEFIAQEDGETNAIDLAEGGQNADMICPALDAPNTTTGISKQEINSNTAANTEALQVRLLYPHEDDTPADDTNHYARWVVQINEHHWGATAAGIA